MENLGKHCTLELYGVDPHLLNDLAFLDDVLRKAAIESGATILDSVFKQFEPQGITMLLLLAESHVSIHTWPENKTAAVDIYTCGDCDPQKAVSYIVEALSPTTHTSRCFTRGGV